MGLSATRVCIQDLFIGKAMDEENHFVPGLFGIQRLTTGRLCLVGVTLVAQTCYSGRYSERSSPHSRAGRSVDGTNTNPAQADVVSAACRELVFEAGEKLRGMMIRV